MNIGIIGAGHIGSALAVRLVSLGHSVYIANSRGPETLKDVAQKTAARPVTAQEAARRGEIIVVTIPLNSKARGGTGDTARTLMICDALTDDRDDMVVKALSWALRELARRVPAAVVAFVDRDRSRLAARVVREVANKVSTGLKNPRRGSPST